MKTNKLSGLSKIMVSLTALLLVLQIVMANRLTTAGLNLDRLVVEREKTEEDNQFLTIKIASYSSLTYMRMISAKAGFDKAAVLYLKPSLGVALKTNVAH